jgi:hypothetical protein
VYCAGIFEHGNAFLLAIKIVLRGSFAEARRCCGRCPISFLDDSKSGACGFAYAKKKRERLKIYKHLES